MNKNKQRISKKELLQTFINKLLVLSVVISVMVVMTACSGIPENTVADLKSALTQRAAQNIEAAQDLRDAGLMTDETYELIIKNIQDNINNVASKITDENVVANLLKSVTNWQVVANCDSSNPHIYDENGNKLGEKYSASEFAAMFITNYVMSSGLESRVKNGLAITSSSGTVMPIIAVDKEAVKNLNDTFAFPMYVLTTDFNNKGLDEIIEAISAACDSKNTGILDQYFKKLTYKDENGVEKDVTLLDTSLPEYQLVRDSRWQGDTSRVSVDDDNKVITSLDSPWKGATTDPKGSNGHDCEASVDSFGATQNRLGYDMVVKSSGYGYDLMSIRLTEFNQDAIENIKNTLNLTEDKYFICKNRVYVMEYPVGYIDGFEESEDRMEYDSIIKRSQISINVRTGDLYKSELNSDGKYTNGTKMSKEDPYLSLNGALSSMDETMASFTIYGETGIDKEDENNTDADEFNDTQTTNKVQKDVVDKHNEPWNLRFGAVKDPTDGQEGIKASVGRIVLRDYLEATYAPGVVSGEQFVVLGRKLRVLQLNGSKSSILAEMYDKEGNVIENAGQPVRLYINDFADLPALKSSSPKVKYISATQESTGDATSGSTDSADSGDDSGGTPATQSEDADTDTSQDSNQDTGNSEGSENDVSAALNSSITKIDRIGTEIVSKVSISTLFPGSDIGIIDKNFTDDKPLFYAMLVRKNIFDTGLFSGWINNTDAGKNSLTWWNQWLQDHGFQYKINSDTLTEYLSGNYAFELTKEGVIILDLRTISKIQEEFDQDTKTHTAQLLHSIFMVVGYIVVGYALVLMIAWNVDVNVDLGFNILEKISFGRWIAVKSYDEMPYMNTDEVNYIKFGDLLVSCIVLITVGIILITVNVVDLILMIIQLFGGIAKYITRIITGR